MNVWEKLPIKTGGGGVWERIAIQPEISSAQSYLSVWEQVSTYPGGLWGETRDKTLILKKSTGQPNLWQQVDEEIPIPKLGELKGMYQDAQEQMDKTLILSKSRPAEVWNELQGETLRLVQPKTDVWAIPKIREFGKYKPVRKVGWALKKLETAKGEPYWVLKNLCKDAYLRLNEQEAFLWDLMDGAHSVQDMAVACFFKYKSLSIDRLISFLIKLHENGFLISNKLDVYQATSYKLYKRSLSYWSRRLASLLINAEFSFKGVDAFYGALFRRGGWLLYTRPAILMLWLVSLAGLPAFLYLTQKGNLSFFEGAGISLGMGLAGLLLAEIFAMFAHESAHALTTKSYGRVVRRGGAGLYFGMVTFFMDTTDIWMEPRRPRLAVTWAGPFSGFFLGGLASLAIAFSAPSLWSGVAYQFATFCYLVSTLNLNPLLKLDGYYLLMDWLEMPMLRERAMRFMQNELWGKVTRKQTFTKEERIFTIFGTLSLVYTIVVIYLMAKFIGQMALKFLEGLFSPQIALSITVLLAAGITLLLAWAPLGRIAAWWRSKRERQHIKRGVN